MTKERADEIVRKVIYSNLRIYPSEMDAMTKEEADFHVGRMVGMMHKTLEVELAKEVEE